jgi:hypothetical protein
MMILTNGTQVRFHLGNGELNESAVIPNHMPLPVQPDTGIVSGIITSCVNGIYIFDVLVRHDNDRYSSYRVSSRYFL